MTELIPLIPGVGAVALAILAGAGGSALLDLYYKPRRDRRRVAGLLFAEIALNVQLLLLQSEVRKRRPREIPEDYVLSTFAFEAAAGLLQELPADLLARVVTLYNRFHAINRNVPAYAAAYRDWEARPEEDPQKPRIAKYLDAVIDTFNTGLDKAFEASIDIRDPLAKLAGVPKPPKSGKTPDFEQKVEQHLRERQLRLEALRKSK